MTPIVAPILTGTTGTGTATGLGTVATGLPLTGVSGTTTTVPIPTATATGLTAPVQVPISTTGVPVSTIGLPGSTSANAVSPALASLLAEALLSPNANGTTTGLNSVNPLLNPLLGLPLTTTTGLLGGNATTNPTPGVHTTAIHTPNGASFAIQVNGPGLARARNLGRGRVAITLLGTTAASQVTIQPALIRGRYQGQDLQIGRLDVLSGQVGSIQATGAALDGPLSALSGSVSTLAFDALGPNTTIDVTGSLGQLMIAGNATLGAGSRLTIAGTLAIGGNLDASGTISAAALSVGGNLDLEPGGSLSAGGNAVIGGNLNDGGQLDAATLNVSGALGVGPGATLEASGPVAVGSDLNVLGGQVALSGNGLNVGRDLNAAMGGQVQIAGDAIGGLAIARNLSLDAAQVAIARDLDGSTSIGGNLEATDGGNLLVGRDLANLAIGGNLELAGGGLVAIGRNAPAIAIGGDLDTSADGQLRVGSDLGTLTVNGAIRGDRTEDLVVGLNLGNLQVFGGDPDLGSIQSADLDVRKSILGLSVSHGIFHSLITAGVLIQGAGAANAVGAVGADGTTAVLDSEIRAGAQILNLTITGDVKSDLPTNPNGSPTRIVAGEDRQGHFSSNGTIDNFQITGSLIDAAIVASVVPYGGNGTITPTYTNTPGDQGFNTYDVPAGTIQVGYLGGPVTTVPNFTAPPYNAAIDPTIDDAVLPGGAINPSFAPSAVPPGVATDYANLIPGTVPIPLPSPPTVLGGVITTAHGDSSDYAGLFAANTSGVLVGAVPTSG